MFGAHLVNKPLAYQPIFMNYTGMKNVVMYNSEASPPLFGGGELKAVVLTKNKNNWVLSLKQNDPFPLPTENLQNLRGF